MGNLGFVCLVKQLSQNIQNPFPKPCSMELRYRSFPWAAFAYPETTIVFSTANNANLANREDLLRRVCRFVQGIPAFAGNALHST